jgi:Protein of unknown function DUF2617
MPLIRPKIAEHTYHLLSRSVHPELFQIHQRRRIERTSYQVAIDITLDGHVVNFKSGAVNLAEVVCSATQLLPKSRRLLAEQVGSKSIQVLELRHHVKYEAKFEIEQVSPKFFWTIHDQLSKATETNGLCQVYTSSGRLPLGAISYISIEERSKSLSIQSVHTFPDDYQLVKCHSVFSVKSAKN